MKKSLWMLFYLTELRTAHSCKRLARWSAHHHVKGVGGVAQTEVPCELVGWDTNIAWTAVLLVTIVKIRTMRTCSNRIAIDGGYYLKASCLKPKGKPAAAGK